MRVFSEHEIQYETGDREQRTVMGFNLYASRPIESHDRKGLERQLRYMGRPPISEQRLTWGSVKLRSELAFQPPEDRN